MPHIKLPENAAGISSLFQAYPETAIHLRALANTLLREHSSLTPGERELIATFVSSRNECFYCTESHAAVARRHLGKDSALVDKVLSGEASVLITPKLQALLLIAEKVRRNGQEVSSEDISKARAAGADDKALHDTVLIAAAFSMFNRYVDGLNTIAPRDESFYQTMGERLVTQGYIPSPHSG